MNEFIPPWPFLEQVKSQLDSGDRKISLSLQAGLPYFCIRLALLGFSVYVISDEERAETFSEDASALAGLFDSLKQWSVGFIPEKSPKEKNALLEESFHSHGIIWFSSLDAFSEPSLSKQNFLQARLELKVGKHWVYSALVKRLADEGYKRVEYVEDPGDFALRGEVVDFWSVNQAKPIRIVYANDMIETMHEFDPGSQRTGAFVPETIIVPISPVGASLVGAPIMPDPAHKEGSIAEFFPEKTVIIYDVQHQTSNAGAPLVDAPIMTDPALGSPPPLGAPIMGAPAFFKRELEDHHSKGFKSFVFCRNSGEAQRLEDILDDLHLPNRQRPQILLVPLNNGFASSQLKLTFWCFSDLTGTKPVVRRLPKFKTGHVFDTISDLKSGDYVVHEKYGIGRYRGLERISIQVKKKEGKISELLTIEYRGGDRLLVPVQDFRLIQKYVGQEGKRPQLSSMDTVAWDRVKQKVREEVAVMAAELLKTAASRALVSRPSERTLQSPTADYLFKEFCEAFPYDETMDQKSAIEAIIQDLESPTLMDRLVCGDVGYGKTEVAMRAAFKVVCRSKQVGILVPTTILAEQHFKNFSDRFAPFPVRIAMISRFQKPAEQKKILEEVKKGIIDILIGTHRLLQKDVFFKDLGLIIMDEEHRFGVKQKEALKKLKVTADILALSATPIPRTLSMALGGVREISVIETPPEGRLPIETYVGLFDEPLVQQSIQKELARGGQVFYVHNRIASIESRKQMLENLIPGLRVGIAHGQMDADGLDQAMWNFLHKKWDILLSTTIIESGLDIPSVNTLIVEDSEEFGLAQLYQLRGRVGRQREKAYCYLFFSGWSNLSEEARKRLEAIREFSALGSGMKLALRDMEIRGMGNLVGAQQHGWMNAVGLEMYCQLLSNAVQSLRVKQGVISAVPAKDMKQKVSLPEVELNISAFIPEEYIPIGGERVSLYKKIASCAGTEELEKLRSEFLDRFGPLPDPAENLFRLMDLRIAGEKIYADSVTEVEKGLILSWPLINGQIPIRFADLAKDYPDLIEILPPHEQNEVKKLDVLFKETSENEIFSAVKKCLQICSQYVIVLQNK